MALFLRKNMPVIAGLSGASLAVILMLLYHYTRDKIPEACFVLGAVVVMLFSVLGFLLGKNFVQLHESNQEPSQSKHFSFGFVDRVEFHTCSKERVCYHERAPCTETIALHKTKARNSVQLQAG